jgi:hypothetical protein
VVTVIVAEPTATAVTIPLVLPTVATPVLEELKVTFLLVALLGEIVAVSESAAPTKIVLEFSLRETLVTETGDVLVAEQALEEVLVPPFEPLQPQYHSDDP